MGRLTFDGLFCDIAMCKETPGGTFCENGSCSQRKVWERLKEYEDKGVEPDMIEATINGQITLQKALEKYTQAEEQGRLVVLPCKVGDTLYDRSGKKAEVEEICIGSNDRSALVCFECDYNCDLCAFNSWRTEHSGENSCDGEYGQTAISLAEIGKTVFLTREEAERALEEQK